jgi:Protein of unknown function (DUF992)
MKRGLVRVLVIGLRVGLVTLAQAGEEKKGVKVGSLRCNEARGWGFVFGSTHDLQCVFTGLEKGEKPLHFTGTIKKFGVDIGYQPNAVLLWAVASTTEKVTPGAMAGTHYGVTAEAAWAAGLGANVLVGGSKKGFALQPVSVRGSPG